MHHALPTELVPKNSFGIIEDEHQEMFDQLQEERAQKLSGDTSKVDRKSAIEIIEMLRDQNQTLKQDLKDLKEIDAFHTKELRKVQEENDMLTSTVDELDGLDYVEAQERLAALKKEIILKMDSLHQKYLDAQTLYNKHLTKLRREIAKSNFEKGGGSGTNKTKPQSKRRDPLRDASL